MVWHGMEWNDMERYEMIWNDIEQYGTIWSGIECTAVVDLRFAELDPHADVFWQNIPIWPALKKKLRIWPYQCCSDMIKIHNTRHYAWHNSNLIVQLKEFICTECRCTTAHCTLLTVTVWQGWLKCIIAASTGPEDYQLNSGFSGVKIKFFRVFIRRGFNRLCGDGVVL